MSFWIFALAMVALAVAALTLPLWRRRIGAGPRVDDVNRALYKDKLSELADDLIKGAITAEQFEKARGDLQHALLAQSESPAPADGAGASAALARKGRWVVAAVVIAVPAAALALYHYTGGTYTAGGPGAEAGGDARAGNTGSDQQKMHSIDKMLARLTERLKANPKDGKGWALLGRTYVYLQRPDDAVEAFAKAAALVKDDPVLLADYADTLAARNDKRLAGKPAALVEQALALDPDQPKALWLAGTVAYQRGDYKTALKHWRHLRSVLPPGAPQAQGIEASIAEAEDLAGGGAAKSSGGQPGKTARSTGQDGAAPVVIHGRVTLSPKLAKRVSPGDTLFIFAKADQGPPMPLAVLRKKAGDLPVRFTLDDSMAMMPALRLSNFRHVVVGARISKSGNAMPQHGDLQGTSGVVSVAAAGPVQITIDHATP
ncbi:MAG TPA: c-type cytochrome biogenesis protein CcmI [Gammaproteobacteria bacterium]|nr:c-type cytochrome biogenesis protein CcmI [Gammaproteobacteria bacterium]